MPSKLKYDVSYSVEDDGIIYSIIKSEEEIREAANFFFDVFLEGELK